ncbi:MAG: HAMP domain-containing histidine kinase [Bacilli bacterium]|nr:HAMP domain-containing histidine kinase [Bacilli bacterium]
MIKKFRNKFIVLALTAIFGFLGIILAVCNIVTWAIISNNGDQLTALLIERNGKFDQGIQSGTSTETSSETSTDASASILIVHYGPGADGGPGSNNGEPEPRFADDDTRFFIVRYNPNGSVSSVDLGHIAAVNEEQAKEIGAAVYKMSAVGFYGDYRYRISSDGSIGAFVDMSRQTFPAWTLLYTSLGVFGGGLLVAGLAMPALAKWMLRPLEESQRKQKRFISNASHELKTPLAIISANNEIDEIERGPTESTGAIARQVARMGEMIQNLNALAKLDESDALEFVPFDLETVAKEAAESFREAYAAKDLNLEESIEPGIQCKGNEQGIKKLLSIMLDNAYKYSLTGAKLTVKKEDDRVVISCENDANLDHEGPMDEVFDRFYRSAEVRASKIEGSGIGLSIAKEIIDLHGGRIHAKGQDGRFIIEARL